MKLSSPDASPPKGWLLAVAGVMLCVVCFCLAMASKIPIWLDEAHTNWVIRDGFSAIFAKLSEDVHPPLYFCLTSWTTALFGVAPWALRLVSILAAAGTVGFSYWAARSYTNRFWALGVALFVGTHPLFIYYGFNARNYELFLLLLTAGIGAILRAALQETRRRDWVLLTVLLVLLINTHNLAVFAFPPLLVAGTLLAGDRWRTTGLRLLCAQAIAFASYLPWFITATRAEGGVAWVAAFWESSGKWTMPIRSLLSYGVGAQYPEYLGPPQTIHGFPILGGILTGILLLASVALIGGPRSKETKGDSGRTLAFALWIGVSSLLLLWLYSWISRPIYLVGRYDLVAFPFLAMLLCLGLQRLSERTHRPAVGASLLILCVAINGYETAQLWTRAEEKGPPPIGMVLDFMASKGRGSGDLVVTRGQLAFLMLEYAADSSGRTLRFLPYPSAFGKHPGWYEGSLFLKNRSLLQDDAVSVAQQVAKALGEGRRVWLVGDGDGAVDEFLFAQLKQVSRPDMANSNPAMRVFALSPR